MENRDIEKLAAYLLKLSGEKFYGKVLVSFQNGRIDTVKTETVQRIETLDAEMDRKRLKSLSE